MESGFRCSYCNSFYSTEKETKQCEDSHIKPKALEAKYKAGYKYPSYVFVELETGTYLAFNTHFDEKSYFARGEK